MEAIDAEDGELRPPPPLWDIYDLAIQFFGFIVRIFFRDISQRGAHAIPQTGPVLFVVGPHSNQFVDPMVVLKTCHPRRCRFLIAQKSHDRRVVGLFSRALQAIPVPRAQDYAVKGSGKLLQHSGQRDLTLLSGHGTDFLESVKQVAKIYPKATSFTLLLSTGAAMEIKSIFSATELQIVKPVSADLHALLSSSSSSSSSSNKKEIGYKVAPYIDQTNVYGQVHDALAARDCIGIFPEGGSHDQPNLLPLKAGVTLMALGAMAKYSHLDVKIVPIGLNYYNPHRFRSRGVVEYGPAITIPKRYVEQYKLGGVEKRKACGALLDTITKALRTVTSTILSFFS